MKLKLRAVYKDHKHAFFPVFSKVAMVMSAAPAPRPRFGETNVRSGCGEGDRAGGRAKPNTGNECDYEAQRAQSQPSGCHMSPEFRTLIRNS